MNPQTSQATVQKAGTRVFILLPFNPNEVWGQKERHHIRGTVNGYMIRGPVVSDREEYSLTLNPSWRRETQIESGAIVEITLFPEGAQKASLAPDIATALEAEPNALTFFESLASFYRNTYIKWIESAKRPETREARIVEMIALLKSGKKQK